MLPRSDFLDAVESGQRHHGTGLAHLHAMDLIPVKIAAETLGLSKGYLRALCRARRVPGAVFDGRRWYLPNGAKVIPKTSGLYLAKQDPQSADARKKADLDARIQRLAAALAAVDGDSPAGGGSGDT
jgi:hypothetical protein